MQTSGEARYTLRCDGGARGNPGPAAYGFVLADQTGKEIEIGGEHIGSVTNNVAEYRGLIAGLEAAIRHNASPLTVYMDSELVVRQMTGEYKVKHEGLKPLHAEARERADKLDRVRYVAVRREENARADQIVNETLDRVLGTESPR